MVASMKNGTLLSSLLLIVIIIIAAVFLIGVAHCAESTTSSSSKGGGSKSSHTPTLNKKAQKSLFSLFKKHEYRSMSDFFQGDWSFRRVPIDPFAAALTWSDAYPDVVAEMRLAPGVYDQVLLGNILLKLNVLKENNEKKYGAGGSDNSTTTATATTTTAVDEDSAALAASVGAASASASSSSSSETAGAADTPTTAAAATTNAGDDDDEGVPRVKPPVDQSYLKTRSGGDSSSSSSSMQFALLVQGEGGQGWNGEIEVTSMATAAVATSTSTSGDEEDQGGENKKDTLFATKYKLHRSLEGFHHFIVASGRCPTLGGSSSSTSSSSGALLLKRLLLAATSAAASSDSAESGVVWCSHYQVSLLSEKSFTVTLIFPPSPPSPSPSSSSSSSNETPTTVTYLARRHGSNDDNGESTGHNWSTMGWTMLLLAVVATFKFGPRLYLKRKGLSMKTFNALSKMDPAAVSRIQELSKKRREKGIKALSPEERKELFEKEAELLAQLKDKEEDICKRQEEEQVQWAKEDAEERAKASAAAAAKKKEEEG